MLLQKILPPLGFTLVLLAIDWYAFQAFRQLFPADGSWRKFLIYAYWVLSVGLLVLLFSIRLTGLSAQYRLLMVFSMSVFFILLLSKLILSLFLLAEDGFRFLSFAFNWIKSKFWQDAKVYSPGRSAALAKIAAGIAAVPVVSLVYGMVKGAYRYRIHRHNLVIKGLPAAFDGFRLVQISDVHAGSFYDPEAVRHGIEMLMKEKPDMVFFTGDLVNNEASEFDSYREIFAEIQASFGVFSVLGNHDYGDYKAWDSPEAKEQNMQDLKIHFRKMGWRLLMDEHVQVEKEGQRITVAGIQNWGARGNFPKYGDLKKAVKGVEKDSVLLLLSHDPSHWEAQVLPEFPQVSAMFSGHTHGMQFGVEIPGFRWSPVQYFYKQWAGLYEKNGQKLYVNRGFGFLGYPGRFGIWPEITSFILRAS
jgi:hypothetical protein